MPKVPKEYIRDFFLQTNILTADEIDLISQFCNFGIDMPEEGNNSVVIHVYADKVLPTRIYNKLTSNPNEKLKIIVESDNVVEDYSKLDEYIQN
ncbi:MAG: hypothetical protein MJ233_03230 [Mycoplasmoidaceae bacterium]|nr:hypothetical protein [Mycoplasmoidaceae bacterium]